MTELITAMQMSEECVCLNAQRAARTVARRYDAAFRPIGISSGQFSILAALNQPDPVAIGVLAQILGMERTTLTRNLAPLEQAGLIRSQSSAQDGRVRGLMLTPAGRGKLALAMPLWRGAQAESLAALDDIVWADTRAALGMLGSL